MSGIIALFCLSLACFTYINSLQFPGSNSTPENTYVEELAPESPEVLPDVELIKRIVRLSNLCQKPIFDPVPVDKITGTHFFLTSHLHFQNFYFTIGCLYNQGFSFDTHTARFLNLFS